MPGIIDSLFVELGLDATKFTEGQKAALAAFRKTQEEAKRRSKEIEDDNRRSLNFAQKVRNEAIGLLAGLAGATGIKNFIANTVSADSATGRLSRNLGISVKEISKWEGVAKIAGGSAEGMASSFVTLSDAFAGWKVGVISPIIAQLRAISTAGGKIIDVNAGVEQSFLDLATNLQKINAQDPSRAGLLGRMLGLDPALFDVLIRGPDAVRAMLKEVEALGHATKDSADAAQLLQTRWNELSIVVQNAGRLVTPFLSRMLNGLTEYMIAFNAYWGGDTETLRKQKEKLGSRIKDAILPTDVPFAGAVESHAKATNRSEAAFSGLPLKVGATGAGDVSLGIVALANDLKSSIKEVTALNDPYHAGTSSQHAKGLALDFTLKDPTQAAAMATALRAKMLALGIDAKVLDEYNHPSARSTGGHIHVGFGSQEAAALFAARAGGGNQTTNIGTINVQTQATDAAGIARDLRGALSDNSKMTSQANGGQN